MQNYRIYARKYFFSSRVVTIGNQLPAEIFNVATVPAFAAKLRSCDLNRYLLQAVYICINFFLNFLCVDLKCTRTCLYLYMHLLLLFGIYRMFYVCVMCKY